MITKCDMCSKQQLEKIIKQVERILKSPGCNRIPMRVEDENDIPAVASHFHTQRLYNVQRLYHIIVYNFA